MHKTLTPLKRSFWIVFLTILTACGTVAPPATPTLTPAASSTSAPTFTPAPTAMPTPAQLPKFPLDGYVMLFNKDNDLYFQDGNNPPIQLTHDREKAHSAMISDDNQKIVFFRNSYRNIYSVNVDGSQEMTLVTNRSLPESLDKEYAQAFVPDTHELLFNTYKCEMQKEKPLCEVGLSIANTDTGETKELVAPGKVGEYNYYGNFRVSPDGKMVSIATVGHIDILGIDGKAIRRDILPYTPSTPDELFPMQFWLFDSSGLIATLPNATNHFDAYGIVPAYSVWRYTIENNAVVQIPLDPFPMILLGCDKFQVSPDGNWILYGGNGDYASSLYRGSLANGQAQLFDSQVCPHFSWSPDSKHFLFANKLGSIDHPPIPIKIINPLGWIDANHFTYFEPLLNIPVEKIRILVAEIRGETIFTYDLMITFPNLIAIKPKQ